MVFATELRVGLVCFLKLIYVVCKNEVFRQKLQLDFSFKLQFKRLVVLITYFNLLSLFINLFPSMKLHYE